MTKNDYKVDYIFEASWEVCNKVGGIFTVLSSKAKTMQELHKDKVIFIGPDVWKGQNSPWFEEDSSLLVDWTTEAIHKENIKIRVGRWTVPGNPIAILVDSNQYYAQKDAIYEEMWNKYKVDSLHAYGDYDESCIFAYATGMVIESFYKFHKLDKANVVAHFDEWMLGMGLLYVKSKLPKVATVFTTHATTIGRSIAGNGKPLYNYLYSYNGDQMAQELNVFAKHSVEKAAAQNADCFTTVSDITARECTQLLECKPVVTPNGFEKDFIPTGKMFDNKRKEARKSLIEAAEKLLGYSLNSDTLLAVTSGRYEYRNKGIDIFIDAMKRLQNIKQLNRDVVAFIMVPAWIDRERADLKERLSSKETPTTPLQYPYLTHWLKNMNQDSVLNQINYLNFQNKKEDKVKIIFVPSYLNGDDGIFNKTYYDLLIGMDVSVFPSYYEPWGYTPHESIAFSVPTITTSLAGFGLWMRHIGNIKDMNDGVEVIQRDDYNFVEVSEDICNRVFEITTKSKEDKKKLCKEAANKASLSDWTHFYRYYKEAYTLALEKASDREKLKSINL